HQENMSPTAPRGSPVSTTCPGPWSNTARATAAAVPVHAAAAAVIGTPSAGAPSTTSVARAGTARVTSTSFTPSTAARPATFTSAPTCPTWPPREAITPGGSSRWPCAWWSKTACPTAWPPGTCGATTASSSPSPRSRTGSRRRGKKGVAQVEAGYLDWALDGFSGYLAADELYDGPFCVLSAVDARRQRRLLYEVLDHDPTRADVLWFLARLKEAIATRGGVVR